LRAQIAPGWVNLARSVPHAEDFAHRYADRLDWFAAIRMEELGIPKDRIGSNDHLHGLSGRAFNDYEREGGGRLMRSCY